MNALIDQLIGMRLHGMANCVQNLLAAREQPSLSVAIKQMIEAETENRQTRSIEYQMRIAKFPYHRDFATFDYNKSAVPKVEVESLYRSACKTEPLWWKSAFKSEPRKLRKNGGIITTQRGHIPLLVG